MTDTDEDRLLAELHTSRLLSLYATEANARGSAAALWAEINRAPDAPISLAVARAMQTDPAIARRYGRMMEGLSQAFSPVALAASDGAVQRRIGDATLRLLPAVEGSLPLLVIENTDARRLELLGADGVALRLELPPADAGNVVLALGPDLPRLDDILALLAAPDTALYLLQ